MAAFLHGSETIEVKVGNRSVRLARTGVIALVGIAPKGPAQQLVQVLNAKDAAQFGSEIPGFNIPEALNILVGLYGVAPILVVNVFNAATHLVAVSAEAKTVLKDGKFKLAHAAIADLVITTTGGSPVTLVKDTNYRVDDFGNVQIITRTTYPDGTNLLASYKRLDPSTVTGSALVGALNGDTGVRTGMKLFEEAYGTFGYKPKSIIAPGYSTLSTVAAAMEALAIKMRGISYVDAPIGTTVSGAIAGRGPAGSIGFNVASERVELCYPHLRRTDPSTGNLKLVPMSVHIAGLRAFVDNRDGFWFSDSNNPFVGVEGTERPITADLSDPNTETNFLNDAGITTYFSSFGTGIRKWGNRSSAWPTETFPTNFVAVRRTADTVYDSLELAMLPFIDKPINADALIDEIRGTCNAFINTLIQRGALVIGSQCTFDPAENSATSISAGQLVFTLTLMAPTPAERITFLARLDTSLFNNIILAAV
jgi:phage tail sheath protein FI